jgi:hypothetical protein
MSNGRWLTCDGPGLGGGSARFWVGTMPDAVRLSASPQNASALARASTFVGERWWGAGAQSADDAARLLREGWPQGLKWARQALPAFDVPPSRIARRRSVRGDWGDACDPERVLRGDVETCWSRSVREARDGARPVVLVSQAACGSDVTGDEYRWRAAAPTLLYEALVSAGYNVSAWLVDTTVRVYPGTGGGGGGYALQVAALGEPASIDRLVAGFGLAGAQRGLGFTIAASEPDASVNPTFGTARTMPDGAAWWRTVVPADVRDIVAEGGRVIVLGAPRSAEEARAALGAALAALAADESAVRP